MYQFEPSLFFKGDEKIQYTRFLSVLFLVASWFFLPLLIWLAAVCLFSLSFNNDKGNDALFFLIAFSLSVLIASRYIGYLWGGADDMPSYLMAYQRYDQFSAIFSTSLIYAKHADLIFSLYSWAIAVLTNNHAFFYYFITVFITYLVIWKFIKLVDTPNPLLCLLFAVIFYKFFQSQWHLIRACMALPILLCGIWYARVDFKKGVAIFIVGGLTHFSTFFLLLPLLMVGRYLDRKWSPMQMLVIFCVLILGTVGLILSVQLIASISGHYMISKIVTRLEFSPGFSKLPTFAFFLFVNIIAIPGYFSTKNISFIRVFNMTSFLSAFSIIALFVMGDELHRILLPFYLLYGPLLVFSMNYYKPKLLLLFGVVLVLTFHMLALTYVLWINESNFLYLLGTGSHPIEYIGLDYSVAFGEYLSKDIEYYDGYRQL